MVAVDEPAETPDIDGAFPRLSAVQLAMLAGHGRRRQMEAGDVLVREGSRDRDFMVVLSGMVAVYEEYGTARQQLIRLHGAGRFLDEIGLLTGQPAFVTSVAHETGEVFTVPVGALREVVGNSPPLGDLLLRAFICRRNLLIGEIRGVRILGSRFEPDTLRLREFMARNRIPHSWIDCDEDAGAEELLRQLGVRPEETPVVWRGNHVLHNPSNAEMARLLGLPASGPPVQVCDLLIVGAGPAGLATAVYGASEGLRTVVVDAVAIGGQAATSSRIENYLGFPAGISGGDLADRAVVQAEKFGAAIMVPAEATNLAHQDGYQVVRLDGGNEIRARTVVIATGARYRRLDVARLGEFEGISVYYAATAIEAGLSHRRPVLVVGSGNSAGQAVLYLSRYAESVRLLIRHDDLGRNMSRYLVDQIERDPAVEVLPHVEVHELVGDGGALEAVVVEDPRTGERRLLDAQLLFVFVGAQPCTDWLQGAVALDADGYVCTGAGAGAVLPADGRSSGSDRGVLSGSDRGVLSGSDRGVLSGSDRGVLSGSDRGVLETSRPGVLAIGDVRSGSIKRVASAVGEGAAAVRLVHEHLARTGRTAGREE